MSKFGVLTLVRVGAWTDDGEITINADHVAMIEVQEGCAGSCTKITMCTGRELCVRGKRASVSAAFAKLASRSQREPSLFEQVFGPSMFERQFP